MKPIVHPPPAIFRAYADLVSHIFVFLRNHSDPDTHDAELISDLANAPHNIGSLFVDYGSWTDDEKCRQ